MVRLLSWILFHVPHDSTEIPRAVRHQFSLTDDELQAEIVKMTDHLTLKLFAHFVPQGQVIYSKVSRLVVDVERFLDDNLEPMSVCGMGVVYERASDGRVLRHPLDISERETLLSTYNVPHHDRLTTATEQALQQFGRALIVDAHSFSSKPLPYERNPRWDRPQICIGTDDFHTPKSLADAFVSSFADAGFTVRLNTPFSGALVPARYHHFDSRVSAVLIEVNRALYLDESTGKAGDRFDEIATAVRQYILHAIGNVDGS